MDSTDAANVSRILQAAQKQVTSYLTAASTKYSHTGYDEFYEASCLMLGNLQANIDMLGKVGQSGNTEKKMPEKKGPNHNGYDLPTMLRENGTHWNRLLEDSAECFLSAKKPEEPNVFEALKTASQIFLRPQCRCGNFYTRGNYISCKNKSVKVCDHCFEYHNFLQQILAELSLTYHTTNPRIICADNPAIMSACDTCCFESWACKCGLTDEQTTSNTQRKHLSTTVKKVFARK